VLSSLLSLHSTSVDAGFCRSFDKWGRFARYERLDSLCCSRCEVSRLGCVDDQRRIRRTDEQLLCKGGFFQVGKTKKEFECLNCSVANSVSHRMQLGGTFVSRSVFFSPPLFILSFADWFCSIGAISQQGGTTRSSEAIVQSPNIVSGRDWGRRFADGCKFACNRVERAFAEPQSELESVSGVTNLWLDWVDRQRFCWLFQFDWSRLGAAKNCVLH
jgi:hypothetical protein